MESLRQIPGVSFSDEISGNYTASSMPTEGSTVTWEGAPILWPWHFGGLFGTLDAWMTGSVDWHDPGGAASPEAGGGWLETRSRLHQDTGGIHGGMRLGYVAGGASVRTSQGDWSAQGGVRRTWLDGALKLAENAGWTDQDMTVRFQDADAALGWRHGPWRALAGWFGSADTLRITWQDTAADVSSWANFAIPVQLAWQDQGRILELSGSLSRYRRTNDAVGHQDTLGRARLRGRAVRSWENGLSGELSLLGERWSTGSAEASVLKNGGTPLLLGGNRQRYRKVLAPAAELRWRRGSWEAAGWAGLIHSADDAAAPQGGASLRWTQSGWTLAAAATRKLVLISQVDQSEYAFEASPSFALLSGHAPRTGLFKLEAGRAGIVAGAPFQLGLSGWLRSYEDFWSWHLHEDRLTAIDSLIPVRSRGWGSGAELNGTLSRNRLGLSGRITLAAAVLRDDTAHAVSRWAPWDQRLSGQVGLSWRWKGSTPPRPGEFFWESSVGFSASTGISRSQDIARQLSSAPLDMNGGSSSETYDNISVRRRTPYKRLDLTPVRLGRQGRWSFWWTLVNVTNETNICGWVNRGWSSGSAVPVSQLPFLPVVAGAQIEF